MKLNVFPIGIPLNLLFSGIPIKKNSDTVCFYGQNSEHKSWKVTNFNFFQSEFCSEMQKSSILQESWTEFLSEVRSEKQQTLSLKSCFSNWVLKKSRWQWNSSRIAIEQNFVYILEEFCGHLLFPLKFCSHSSKIQRSAIFQSRILLTFLEKVEK